ncbi:hypothetical protein D3C71_1536060 [compost metagenome]
MEQADGTVLQGPLEIDQHVAAGHQVDFGEHGIGGQTVVGEHDVALQAAIEHHAAVAAAVVIRERAGATGRQVVAAELRQPVQRERTGFGGLQRFGIDVGGVDDRPVQQAFLVQQDRQRPHFFAGTAPGNPQLDRGIGAQHRHGMLTQHPEIRRVAEHLRDLHGEVLHRLGEGLRLMQQPVLQRPHGRAVEARHGMPHAPPQRCQRIVTEVVVVALVDRLQQQLQLQVEQLRFIHRREHHTRHSETSLSTSIGLAM